jgi:hypothetical protein
MVDELTRIGQSSILLEPRSWVEVRTMAPLFSKVYLYVIANIVDFA